MGEGAPGKARSPSACSNNRCAPLANTAAYVWHCDKDGACSGYDQPGANTVGQTFCRGIQVADAGGAVAFTTLYPGWYAGRITHVHFQARRLQRRHDVPIGRGNGRRDLGYAATLTVGIAA